MARMSLDKLNDLLQQALITLPAGYETTYAHEQTFHRRQQSWVVPSDEVTVAEVLEEGIPPLFKPNPRLDWGRTPMLQSWGRSKSPATTFQPSFDFECYQCGRPVTRHHDRWTDHAGSYDCDGALMHYGEPWSNHHQPKPFHGEEEDA